MPNDMSITFLSLFSGAGLMDLGFELEGFELVGAVEFEPPLPRLDGRPGKRPPPQYATETWRRNRPGKEHLLLNRDVRLLAEAIESGRTLADDEVRAFVDRLRERPPRVVIGGPPCQSFSLAGKRQGRYDPEKCGLAWVMIDIVKRIKPEVVVFENVPGLETVNGGYDFKLLLNAWMDAGYVPHYVVLNAADYGVPQKRWRLIIVAVRSDVARQRGAFVWPAPTHAEHPEQLGLFDDRGRLPWVTVRQAIGDLPQPSVRWYPLNRHDEEHALGRQGGIRDGGPQGLHDPDAPGVSVLARKENYLRITESADGKIVAARNGRTVGVDPNAPAPTIRNDVAHGDRGFWLPYNHDALRLTPSDASYRLRQLQDQKDGQQGGMHESDSPAKTIPARAENFLVENHEIGPKSHGQDRNRKLPPPGDPHQPQSLDEPSCTVRAEFGSGVLESYVVIENHGPTQYLKPEQVRRVLESGRFNPAIESRPSPTIKAVMGKGAQNDQPYLVLPAAGVRLRRLTVRECARLQSVPDDYVFHGPLTACYRQVGNGVPVLFARHLARAVRSYLFR